MTFQPVLPLGGYAGWRFLSRTLAAQQETFDKSAEIQRDTAYFAEKIGSVTTAEELVADRRLLSVALGAYGLEDDLGAKAFVTKVLREGSLAPDAFANRLTDKRYLAFTKAFGFGDFAVPRTMLSDFPDQVNALYRQHAFEVAVGEQDPDLRLALGFSRDLDEVLAQQSSDNGRWYAIMGNQRLRKVIETALGLPSSFGTLDLDQQLAGFRDVTAKVLGKTEVADIAEPEAREKLTRLFLIRSEAARGTATGPGSVALTLLQGAVSRS